MQEKEENKPKLKVSANDLLDIIVSETFTRHKDLTEQEMLDKLGIKQGETTEDKAINVAIFNLLIACTKEMLAINQLVKTNNGILELYLGDRKDGRKDD